MPVETPSRASIETVKAVPNGVSFWSVIWRSPSTSQRSGVRHRQISPRPCVAMKLTASGVTNCAAIVRSPSFSRSSSSTTTTNRPARISSIASSTVAKTLLGASVLIDSSYSAVAELRRSCPGREKALDVLREDVDLEVDAPARLERARASSRRACAGSAPPRTHRRAAPAIVSETPSTVIEPFSTQ